MDIYYQYLNGEEIVGTFYEKKIAKYKIEHSLELKISVEITW